MEEVTSATKKEETIDSGGESPQKGAETNDSQENNATDGPSVEVTTEEEGRKEEETKKDKNFNTTNFSAVERSWIIYFLGVARGQTYRNFNDLSVQVYKKLCELLERQGHRVPSQRSVRMMWKTFVDTGTMAKPKGGGRPKLPPEMKKQRKKWKRKKKVEEESANAEKM